MAGRHQESGRDGGATLAELLLRGVGLGLVLGVLY
jgi:hypothetical protein